MGAVPDTTEDFWAFKDWTSRLRTDLYRREPKIHFLSEDQALCKEKISREKLSKKKSNITCKGCQKIMQVMFPYCPKCLWAQSCKDCRDKHSVHIGICGFPNRLLSTQDFLKAPNRCLECLNKIIPRCNCCDKSYMVLRRNKTNGNLFWGCSYYPKCNNTKSI